MFASGNIRPQSIRMIVRSGSSAAPCSIAMQFRPISPRPPRKTTRTGTDGIRRRPGKASATGGDQAFAAHLGRRVRVHGASAPWGPALPDVMTERSQHGLRRYRVRCVVAGLELEALELAGVDPAGSPTMSSCSQGRTSPRDRARTSGWRRRSAPTAPMASSGRVMESSPRVDLEVHRCRALTARSLPGSLAASLSATMLGTSCASRSIVRSGDLAAGTDRDVVQHDRKVASTRRSPGCGSRCPPGTDGCSTGRRRGSRRCRAGPPPR